MSSLSDAERKEKLALEKKLSEMEEELKVWTISAKRYSSFSLCIKLHALIRLGVTPPSFDTGAWNVELCGARQSHWSLKKFWTWVSPMTHRRWVFLLLGRKWMPGASSEVYVCMYVCMFLCIGCQIFVGAANTGKMYQMTTKYTNLSAKR
jgi:hypothetical protein